MSAVADTDRLLDLLREAGDEAVTLDELTVVGVQDPASALLSLELAGFGVERIYERCADHTTRTCVRLAGAPPVGTAAAAVDDAYASAAELPAVLSSRAVATTAAADHRPLLAVGVIGLLLLLVSRR